MNAAMNMLGRSLGAFMMVAAGVKAGLEPWIPILFVIGLALMIQDPD